VLQLKMRLLECRMSLVKTRILCLKHGYLPTKQGNLAADFVLRCNAAIHHPVEIINVFLECWHKHWRAMSPNVQSSEVL
jgi:hypothetical protein